MNQQMPKWLVRILSIMCAVVIGCGCSSNNDGCHEGTKGCACIENKCLEGLICNGNSQCVENMEIETETTERETGRVVEGAAQGEDTEEPVATSEKATEEENTDTEPVATTEETGETEVKATEEENWTTDTETEPVATIDEATEEATEEENTDSATEEEENTDSGSDETEPVVKDSETIPDSDSEALDTQSSTEPYTVDFVPITSQCDTEKTCAGLEHPKDCIADFELGTVQAGSRASGYETYVGFYGIYDYTPNNEPIPSSDRLNPDTAWKVKGCDPASDEEENHVVRMAGNGFMDWGAGMGFDWGHEGKVNPDCNYEHDGTTLSDDNECLEIAEQNRDVLVSELEKSKACQDADGNPDPQKMRCAIYSRTINTPRDLSQYKGIGFWVMREDPSTVGMVNVAFPIRETTRWHGNPDMPEAYRLDELYYDEGYCSDDDGDKSTQCNNHFSYMLQLPEANGKWEYREVFFSDLAISTEWGLQLNYESFPLTRSIGLRFLVDMSPDLKFDFYLDDIHLIRN